MRYKLLFGLLFLASALMANQVVFDPAAYDPEDLPEGMEIVEIEGESYCKIILNGWNSLIPVEDVIVDPGRTHFRMEARLALGASDTLSLTQVNTFLKLANFRAGNVEIGAAGSASSEEFKEYVIGIALEDTVTGVQVAGQETLSWGPVTGDTLWIGKVELITYDPSAVLDPGSIDPDDLPEGQSIEMIDGEEYVKVILNGWNSTIPVKDRIVTAASSHFVADAKLAIGASDTLTLGQVNTFLKLANFRTGNVEIGAAGSASSEDFTTYTVSITTLDTITHVQIAGQQTISWGAITGDTLWIGKLVLVDLANPGRVDNLLAEVDWSDVILTWDAATDNDAVDHYEIYQDDELLEGDENGLTYTVSDLADATYTFGVVTVDASGNKSGAREVEVTINSVGIEATTARKLNLYPNPASTELNISGIESIQSVQVIGMNGAIIMEMTDSSRIDISDLNAGMYLIRVRTASEVISDRFVKE